jgi:hypothetical protein
MNRVVLAVVLSTGLIATGAVSASAASTRAEYIAQVDPICEASNQGLTRLWKRFVRADKQHKLHTAGNALATIATNLVSSDAKLQAIPPPPGDEARVSQWLGMFDQIAHNYKISASAYRLGTYKRVSRLIDRSDRLNRNADSLMADFPFQVCAQ